jgi:plasmid stabilization system protein ParE
VRAFVIAWRRRASLQILEARAFVGVVRAAALDDEIEAVTRRLAACPEMGAPVRVRGAWPMTIRKVPVGRTGYDVYYRVNLKTERIVMLLFWHEARQAPKL